MLKFSHLKLERENLATFGCVFQRSNPRGTHQVRAPSNRDWERKFGENLGLGNAPGTWLVQENQCLLLTYLVSGVSDQFI